MNRQPFAVFSALAFAVALASPLKAQTVPAPAELPTTERAKAWIEQDPAVIEARRAADAAAHGAAALAAGPHEWTSRVAAQRRSYRDTGSTSDEWSAQLERGIRIGGKADIDRELADTERSIALARVGEARHEAARALAELWLGSLVSAQAQARAREQLTFAETSLAAVEKRKRAGDASALDLHVAEGDLAEVRRQASLADSQADKALARLRVRFPGADPAGTQLSDPIEPAWPEVRWRERILQESDPLKIAAGLLRKAELAAARAKADRLPDPIVGIYAASEGFRNERIVGLSLSLPLGGTVRVERERQTLVEVEVARTALERQRRDTQAAVAETFADAGGGTRRWRPAAGAAIVALETARLTQRAFSLGEAELQALLMARRQSVELARAATEARGEALRASHRLLVDAHLIWDLEHD